MTAPWNLILSGARNARTIVLAAPYIKEDSLKRLLDSAPHSDNLTCVSRWNPGDVAAGATDVTVRGIVLGRGGSFLIHPTLHAKYYRFDDLVFIGSANLTASGLGLIANHNLEILSPPSKGFDSESFEKILFSRSRVVSDAEYAYWESISSASHPSGPRPESQVSLWRPLTRDPEDLWLVYSDAAGHTLSESVRDRTLADLQAIMAPPDLQRSSFFVWLATALLSSPFASEVLSIPEDAEPQAFIKLGESWNMTPGDARYAAETVYNWLSVTKLVDAIAT